jgi:hypothetical protein
VDSQFIIFQCNSLDSQKLTEKPFLHHIDDDTISGSFICINFVVIFSNVLRIYITVNFPGSYLLFLNAETKMLFIYICILY